MLNPPGRFICRPVYTVYDEIHCASCPVAEECAFHACASIMQRVNFLLISDI